MAGETDTPYYDRRGSRRYPIARPLRYHTGSGLKGEGETINISSKGILFRCGAQLPVGDLIEAELDWPFFVDDEHSRGLKVYGMIVRSDDHGTAMAISKYEFPRR